MKNLQNKNVIIFGATSYIGHELSTILAKKGVNLIIHGNSSKKLESLHYEISLESSKVISIKHNVLSEKFYLELFKTVSSKFLLTFRETSLKGILEYNYILVLFPAAKIALFAITEARRQRSNDH